MFVPSDVASDIMVFHRHQQQRKYLTLCQYQFVDRMKLVSYVELVILRLGSRIQCW